MDSKLLIIPCDLREVPGTSQQAPGTGNRASVPTDAETEEAGKYVVC